MEPHNARDRDHDTRRLEILSANYPTVQLFPKGSYLGIFYLTKPRTTSLDVGDFSKSWSNTLCGSTEPGTHAGRHSSEWWVRSCRSNIIRRIYLPTIVGHRERKKKHIPGSFYAKIS